ncbi:MAG: GNAT family N-acetyltransferase [Bradyrhizobiaceae bacterium]|nr:GNAT family N-acetyltransferase [Bradyrhizobiaceae bacterium]
MRSVVDAADGRLGAYAPADSPLERRSAAVPAAGIRVSGDLREVESAWRALEAGAAGTVFQTFDFAVAWQKSIGAAGNVRPAIVILSGDKGTLAIFPLAVAGGVVRRLTWLGQEIFDYLGPLLARDFAQSVPAERFAGLWREIRSLLQQDARFRHDMIDLRRMPEDIGGQRNPFLALGVAPHPSNGYVTTLRGTWDEFYQNHRSAKARKQDRSKLRRLEEFGPVDVFTAEDRAGAERLLDALFEQKAETFRRKGIGGFTEKPACRAFFRELALGPRTKGMAHLSALRVGERLAAVNLAVEHAGRYSLLQVSYDEEFARCSPGAIHLTELFRRAIGRGLQEFDFLVGYQRLKHEWSDREIPLFDHVAPATIRGVLPAAATWLATTAKRHIKQNERLWTAFQNLRARVGAFRSRLSR